MRKATLVATGVLIVLAAAGLFGSERLFGFSREQFGIGVVLLLALLYGIIRLLRRRRV